MRETGVVVPFGVCFQEVIRPIANGRLCPGLQFLPEGKDLLVMEVSMLKQLYWESGSSEENKVAQVTLAGTHLHRSSHLFAPCQKVPKQNEGKSQICECERIQEVVWKKDGTRITTRDSGVIIIGKASSHWMGFFSNGSSAHTSSQPQHIGKSRTPRSLSTVGHASHSYKAPILASKEAGSSWPSTVSSMGRTRESQMSSPLTTSTNGTTSAAISA
jgi:hypothetical protein